jgi:ribosomal protein S2
MQINFSKKKRLPKIRLFNMLLKSKMIFGETLKKTKPETLPFIYGIRHNYTIININHLIKIFVRIYKLLIQLKKDNKKLDKKILIIGNSIDMKFMINKHFIKNKSSILFLKKSWKHGLITNCSVKNKHRNKELEQKLKDEKIQLVIVLKSALYEPVLLNELKNIKVPIIAITTTKSNLKNIQYPIISSSNNIKALYALLYAVRKLI